jgi:hypothetical protein
VTDYSICQQDILLLHAFSWLITKVKRMPSSLFGNSYAATGSPKSRAFERIKDRLCAILRALTLPISTAADEEI